MGTYPTEKIRNLGIVAHGGAGKTSLSEAILFNTGMIDRLGRVDDGTSTMDFEPEEVHALREQNLALLLGDVQAKAAALEPYGFRAVRSAWCTRPGPAGEANPPELG